MAVSTDVITRTVAFALFSACLLIADDWRLLSVIFIISVVAAIRSRLHFSLLGFAILGPTLPIFVSHFGIEPLLSGQPIDQQVVLRASQAWLRLVGMVLVSLAWISSLNFSEACGLCRLLGMGQLVLVPLVTASTYLRTTRYRWTAIREATSLQRSGPLARRKAIPLRHIPSTGLQLVMSSLVRTSEIALGCEGRGIGSRHYLAVHLPRVTVLGRLFLSVMLFLVLVMVVARFAGR